MSAWIRGVLLDAKVSIVGKDHDGLVFEETDCGIVDRGYHFHLRGQRRDFSRYRLNWSFVAS